MVKMQLTGQITNVKKDYFMINCDNFEFIVNSEGHSYNKGDETTVVAILQDIDYFPTMEYVEITCKEDL